MGVEVASQLFFNLEDCSVPSPMFCEIQRADEASNVLGVPVPYGWLRTPTKRRFSGQRRQIPEFPGQAIHPHAATTMTSNGNLSDFCVFLAFQLQP
jgi:hypothetical protein